MIGVKGGIVLEKDLDKFLGAVKNNPKLKEELKELTKAYSDRDIIEDFSLEEQVKFIHEVVIPFANLHGFKIILADVILGEGKQEVPDNFLENATGGLGINKKFLASTLLALQTLTAVVPSSASAHDNNIGGSMNATSVSDTVKANQADYETIVNLLTKNGNNMHPISAECPFNEVDGMILSTISYLPLNCVPAMNSDTDDKEITISEWSKCFSEYFKSYDKDLNFHDGDTHRVEQYRKIIESKQIDSMTKGRRDLLKLVGTCPRYKDITIGNFFGKYVEYKQNARFCEQLAAVTYTLEDGTKLVNFRGTDATLAGWKEDLDLSWSKTIPAQEDALKYLEKIFAENPDVKYVVTGHSKGGNLAQYASFCLSSKNKKFMKHLDKVFNYDGPGLNKDTISSLGSGVFDEVSKKLTNFIPQSSTIGRLLSDTSKSKYVCVYSQVEKSTDIFGQHDALTWNVAKDYDKKGSSLLKFQSHSVQISSDFVARATSSFMSKVDKNNAMRFFVQWLFDFIVKNDISIQGDQSLQSMCGSVFYNYFVKNKTYAEVIYSVFHPSKVVKVDESESKKFKNVARAAYKSFLSAYWERHVDINREVGVPDEVNSVIEEMVDQGCSFDRIYKLMSVTANKVLTWQNVKNFFKKLYS